MDDQLNSVFEAQDDRLQQARTSVDAKAQFSVRWAVVVEGLDLQWPFG